MDNTVSGPALRSRRHAGLHFSVMADITCARCGETREQTASPPFPNDLGGRIFDTICQVCWEEWLQQQTAVINHYGLDLREAESRKFLVQQTESFLFGEPQT